MKKNDSAKNFLAKNKKAYFDYFVEKEYEAGIALKGSEVKSIRQGHVNLTEAFVHISPIGEVRLINCRIQVFFQANINNHEPLRTRKLLLNKKEIQQLKKNVMIKGYTILPLSIYLKGYLVKVKIGLCKGKKKYDKRESEKKEATKKAMARMIKNFNNS